MPVTEDVLVVQRVLRRHSHRSIQRALDVADAFFFFRSGAQWFDHAEHGYDSGRGRIERDGGERMATADVLEFHEI
jgi:hypothetical protein